jgi:hypothetical protein
VPYFIGCVEHMAGLARERPAPPWLRAPALREGRPL